MSDEEYEDDAPSIQWLASALGYCLTCCDAGTPGALLENCDHPDWSVDVHDTSNDTATITDAANELETRLGE